MSSSQIPDIGGMPKSAKAPNDVYSIGTTLTLETDEYFESSAAKAVLLTRIIRPVKVGRCQVSQLVLVRVNQTLCPYYRPGDVDVGN